MKGRKQMSREIGKNMFKHLTVAGILLLLCLPLVAGAAVLVDDPFTDGAKNNGADPLDINWWNANGISPEAELTIENDSAGLENGNSSMVFTVGSSSVSRKFYGTFGTVDLLNVGDGITLSFDFRYTLSLIHI